MRKPKYHTSYYRGSLMTFQHYLNTYHTELPFEAKNDGGSQFYTIKTQYVKGMPVKIVIERDKEFRNKPTHYLNQQSRKPKAD